MLRLAMPILVAVLFVPVLVGIVMISLPAFSYMPVFGGDQLNLDIWRQLFNTSGIWRSITISLASGLLTAAFSVSLVFLYLACATGSRLDRWLRRVSSPLLSLPHAAAAFGLAFLIAPSGFLTRLISPILTGWQRPPDLLTVNDPLGLSLILALIVKEVPFLLLMALVALPQIDPDRRVTIARSLGYSPAPAWLKVVAPALYPLIRLPLFAVIVFAASTVEVALILGPSLPGTLSVRVLEWFADPDLDFRFLASAGALLQLMVCVLALGIWMLLEKCVALLWRLWVERGRPQYSREVLLRIIGIGGVSISTVIVLASVVSLTISGLARTWRFPDALPTAWTVSHWSRAISNAYEPLLNTLAIGGIASALALFLVICCLEQEHRSTKHYNLSLWFLYIPLLVPQIAFLFGIVVATEFLRLPANIGLIVFGHLLFVLPYVFLSLTDVYRNFDPRWSQMALTLGASQNRAFWRIRFPLLLAPILTAAALGFTISVGQYLATQLLGGGRIVTITTEAVALSSGGSRANIAVWAQMQMLLPVLGFALALCLPKLLWRNRSNMHPR